MGRGGKETEPGLLWGSGKFDQAGIGFKLGKHLGEKVGDMSVIQRMEAVHRNGTASSYCPD